MTTNLDNQSWLQSGLTTLTTNIEYQSWLPTLTTNIDYQPWLQTLTTNLDYQPCWPTLTTNLVGQPWIPTLITNQLCPRNAQDMLKVCTRYSQEMPKICSRQPTTNDLKLPQQPRSSFLLYKSSNWLCKKKEDKWRYSSRLSHQPIADIKLVTMPEQPINSGFLLSWHSQHWLCNETYVQIIS